MDNDWIVLFLGCYL